MVLILCLHWTYQEEGNDGIMESSNAWKVADPIQVPVGPITRARAKKFKEALNGLIHEVE